MLGIAAYLVFLAALAPASFVASRVGRDAHVRLDEARGTLWNGSARATVGTPGATVVVDRVEWHFVPSQLLAGKLAYDLRAVSPQLEAAARLTHGFGGLAASEVSARADAALASALSPLAAAWRPEGSVTLAAPRLAWNDREIRGDAVIEWKGGRIAAPQPRELGTYHAELHGDGGPAKVTVATVDGAWPLRGAGTLTPQALEMKGQAGGQDFAIRLP